MSKDYGILLISHVEDITAGLVKLLNQVAGDVTIKTAGGGEDGDIGTSFDKIRQTLEEFEEDAVLAFYDLGSAKMNLEMAMEGTDKEVLLFETAFVEGSYVAASLLQTDVDLDTIKEQLEPLTIKE
jgi:dihydroxyacetone kinase phosphotransfer subunit